MDSFFDRVCRRRLVPCVLALGVASSSLAAEAVRPLKAGPPSGLMIAVPGQDANISPSAILSPQQWRLAERSTDKALAWLAQQQRADGSFETIDTGQPAITALCLLAFLSRGHLPDEGPYGQVIHRGLEFVLSCQQPDGLIAFVFPNVPVSEHNASHTAHYNHAIGGLLLSESLGMTTGEQNARMIKALDKAVAYTRGRQKDPKRWGLDEGGWRYAKRYAEDDSDLSVTSWQLMFLRSCRNAGFDVPAREIDRAVAYVRNCFDQEQGAFVYALRAERRITRCMTAAGVLSLALGGQHQTELALTAGNWILRHRFDRFGRICGDGDRFFYGAFYCSQAAFQLGGKYWEAIYPVVLDLLVRSQLPEGAWVPETNPDSRFGQCYSTALAVLALSTPHQMLPIFQR